MKRLNEDFTNLYKRWRSGEKRKEYNIMSIINDFIESHQNYRTSFTVVNDEETGEPIVNCDGICVIRNDDLIDGKLPFKFGWCSRDFGFYSCNDLISLEGCPEKIGEDFTISNCNKLSSLKYSPKKIGVSLSMYRNNKLKNLIGCTQDVGGSIFIQDCEALETLEGITNNIEVSLNIKNCPQLSLKKHFPKTIKDNVDIRLCDKIQNIDDLPIDYANIKNEIIIDNHKYKIENL